MSKMNRRNYLSLIGAAGAGLMIGAGCNNVSPKKNGSEPTPPQTATGSPEGSGATLTRAPVCSRGFKDWPTSANAPLRCASVTLIFEGLMGFFYEHQESRIAFHAGHKHKPELKIWEKPVSACQQALCTPRDAPAITGSVKYIDLKVVGRDNRVDFYKPGDCLDRIKGDAMDFRWLPDLAEFYGQLKVKKNQFEQVVRIKDGTFYTRMITDSIFQRVDSRNKLSEQAGTIIGRVAHIMAAGIQLEGDEHLLLELKDDDGDLVTEPIPLKPEGGKVLELQFFNTCPKADCVTPKPCEDGDEKKRNDFHYMRKVLDGLDGKPKYSIALAAGEDLPLPIPPVCNVELTQRTDGDYCGSSVSRATDEAPCAGAGYGGGGGCNCV